MSVPKSSGTEIKYARTIGILKHSTFPTSFYNRKEALLVENAGPLYFGIIADVNPDGTHDIQYDDGDGIKG